MNTAVRIALAATAWLALGIPLWLYTIEVDRASLNFEELERYEALAFGQIKTAIHVAISDALIPDLAPATELVINRQLADQGLSYRFVVSPNCSSESELCLEARMGEHDVAELNAQKKVLEITYRNQTLIDANVPLLASMLLLEHFYKKEVMESAGRLGASADQENYDEKQNREDVTVRYSPKYHLSFSLFSEKGKAFNWDIGAALKTTLGALLSELDAGVAALTIDTQTGLYAEMGTTPKIQQQAGADGEETEEVRVLEPSQLSTFVDFAEWKLASSLPYPTLNFVLYIPDSPLVIEGTDRKLPQFIVPQWGGVVISEPKPSGHKLSEEDLAPILDIFARQLLALLGVREPVDQPKSSRAPTWIILARMSRDWAAQGLREAAKSLNSLRRLALSMPHIPIPKGVAQNAALAMREFDAGVEHLAVGDHVAAGACARRAQSAANRAFFDKHMVAQAYFPDEHKLAVYMPLIGPLCVVVLSGWIRIIRKKKDKARQTKAEQAAAAQISSAKDEKASDTQETENDGTR